jgi:uncharacterized protein (TIGR02145 family)
LTFTQMVLNLILWVNIEFMRKLIGAYFTAYLSLIPFKRAILFFNLIMILIFLSTIANPTTTNFFKPTDNNEFERLETCGTITDIDGNVYETVMVAGECWIRSNLRVKHYRNGDPIPEIQDQQEWADAKTGAWCYYDNDPANEEKYGLLYNFYAILDPRGIAPEGWEVPSLCEFHNITTYYGNNVAGDKIRDPNYWERIGDNYNPDNESGLTVLPGGFRTDQLGLGAAVFQGLNWAFVFWTTTTGNGFNILDWPNIATSTVSAPFFNVHTTYFHPNYGVNIRLSKIKELTDPKDLQPLEIYGCELKSLREFLFSFPETIGRTACLFTVHHWENPFFCFDLEKTKVFKADPNGDLVELDDRFEYDIVYYFLIGDEVGVSTCNVEYKPIVFRRPLLLAPEGDEEQFFCGSARISDFEIAGEDLVWYDTEESENILSVDLILENGKKYYVSQRSSGCEIAERLEVTARLSSPSVPTGAAVQEFCHEATIEDLEVEGENILWYDEEGAQLPLSAGLSQDAVYSAVSREGDCESEALEIRVVLKSTPAPQAEVVQRFCSGASLSDIEVSGEYVKFYSSAESSNPLDSEILLEFGKEYFISQTIEGCESRDKTRVKVELREIPLPETEIVQVFCNQAFISDLRAIGENIRWYKDQSLTTIMDTGTALENQEFYFVTQTVDGCESAPVEVKVTINAPGKPTGDTDQEFCGSANLSDLVITGENIRWYPDQNAPQEISGEMTLEDGKTYYATQTLQGCESAERLAVKVQIYRPDQPVGQNSLSVCEGALLEELNVDGTGLTWYDAAAGGNPLTLTTLLEHGKSYFVSQTVGGCESERLQINVEILNSLVPVAENQQVFCALSAPKVKDLFAVGEQILWYQFETGGNPLSDDAQLENGMSYYAANFNSIGCESPLRKKVDVQIQVCEVEVYNLVTLDGNDRNAYFKIKDIEYFPENRLEVFNRYGVMVYSMDSYGQEGNYFYGESNVAGVREAGKGLPTGNYLYVLTYKVPAGGRTEKVSGYLHLINAKR